MKNVNILKLAALAVLASTVCIEAVGNAPDSSDWESFKEFHMKMYASDADEDKFRANFEKNAQDVAEHNAAYEAGKVTYSKELNSYADQDPKEFSRIRNGYKPRLTNSTASYLPDPPRESLFERSPLEKRKSSDRFDWRDQKKVSPVKNQGQCGSCWAFSSTGAMEAQILIKNKSPVTFSEEQLVDCDGQDSGCGGGIYEYAWDYIKNNGGIESDSDYPYTAGGDGQGGNCQFDSNSVAGTVSGYQQVSLDEASVKKALQTVGPLSISLDGEQLQHYSQGVYSCSRPQNNHAVLLVGFGNVVRYETDAKSGKPVWIVKNSWGENWGENGYVRISRSTRNGEDCGIISNSRRGSNIAYPKM